jgi:hypothetical protein
VKLADRRNTEDDENGHHRKLCDHEWRLGPHESPHFQMIP